MSYARFGWAGSSVYVFAHVDGFLQCCACGLNPVSGLFPPPSNFDSVDGLLDHLREHRAVGDTVPQETFDDLLSEQAELDAWLEAK